MGEVLEKPIILDETGQAIKDAIDGVAEQIANTYDYTKISNKPSINGNVLTGNKTSAELGIQTEIEDIASADLTAMWGGSYTHTDDKYLSDVGADSVIGEVKDRLNAKANTSDLGTAAAKDFTTAIAEDGADLPTSGAVYMQIQSRIAVSEKGVASGVAELDSNGLVPTSQLPSYVDDVLEGTAQNVVETGAGTYSATGFILTGETEGTTLESGKTYVDVLSNIQYRWTGTGNNLVSMGTNLTLGVLENTAYRGDRGKIAYDDSQTNKTSIGTMANLTTTEKGSLVGAVNELDSGKVNGEGMTLSVNADGTLRVTYDDGQ